MFIEDDEKEPRKAALHKLMGVMSSMSADNMRNMKDPNRKMTMDEDPDDGRMEADGFEGGKMPGQSMSMSDDDADGDGDGPSAEEKMKISEMYHKYCK